MLGADKVDEFEANGFAVFRGFLDRTMLSKIVAEYDQACESAEHKLIDKDAPTVVFWTHVRGERKRLKPLEAMPRLQRLATEGVVPRLVKRLSGSQELRLLETIIFNKPPGESNVLRWHQDVAYFPFEPNNQLAVWLPFDVVTRDVGAMSYARGSHRAGLMGSTDLHSGARFKDEDRPLIPEDPEADGYQVVCVECEPGDMIVHHGQCWHMSGRNVTKDRPRRGLSLRYLVGETVFRPRPGSAAAFIEQLELVPGQTIDSPAFPVVA